MILVFADIIMQYTIKTNSFTFSMFDKLNHQVSLVMRQQQIIVQSLIHDQDLNIIQFLFAH